MNLLTAAHEGMTKGLREKYGKRVVKPTTISATIKAAIVSGFTPYLMTGKKVVRMYLCHECKANTMIKAYNKTSRWNACRCGYRSKF